MLPPEEGTVSVSNVPSAPASRADATATGSSLVLVPTGSLSTIVSCPYWFGMVAFTGLTRARVAHSFPSEIVSGIGSP